jgi:hypothetical protein
VPEQKARNRIEFKGFWNLRVFACERRCPKAGTADICYRGNPEHGLCGCERRIWQKLNHLEVLINLTDENEYTNPIM